MLSEYMDYTFVDTDDLIEQRGRKLQVIIDSEGDEALLKIEREILLGLGGSKNIFSPGGSCVFSPDAMDFLREISLLVFIDVPFDVLEKRFRKLDASKRGIIGLKKYSFKGLFELRHKLYEKYAHVVVRVVEHSTDDSFKMLLQELKPYLS